MRAASWDRQTAHVVRQAMIEIFITDLDGCLTDGTFWWTADGQKFAKRFGPDDATALKELHKHMPVIIVSADTRGRLIGETRAAHMGIPFREAGEHPNSRLLALRHICREYMTSLEHAAYVGDGRCDAAALREAGRGFAPADAYITARRAADVVLENPGGRRAVAEAVDHIFRHYHVPGDGERKVYTG